MSKALYWVDMCEQDTQKEKKARDGDWPVSWGRHWKAQHQMAFSLFVNDKLLVKALLNITVQLKPGLNLKIDVTPALSKNVIIYLT